MPTFRHGKNSYFQLDNAAGALVDISNVLSDIAWPRTVETGETTSFGQQAKTYIIGLSDSTVSCSGKFDATVDAHLLALIAALQAETLASASVVYGPEGSTSGRIKYTAEAVVTKYEVSAPVGDVVTFSLELQISGAVTRTTF